jgi:hypothetical protein
MTSGIANKACFRDDQMAELSRLEGASRSSHLGGQPLRRDLSLGELLGGASGDIANVPARMQPCIWLATAPGGSQISESN